MKKWRRIAILATLQAQLPATVSLQPRKASSRKESITGIWIPLSLMDLFLTMMQICSMSSLRALILAAVKSLWDSWGDKEAQFSYVVLHHVHGVVGAGLKRPPDSKSLWDAASVLGLTDPRLCYMLDGFLFIYAVVMTALFVKAKLSQPSEPQLRAGQEDVYNKLSRGHRDDYDVLGGKRGADPELGGRHQQRRKNPQDTVYTSLQKDKMGEAYSEIGMKGEQRRRGKGNEGLYQGLSAATKDTYDALQMQPLPPR